MRQVVYILKKEIKDYFISPIAYIVIAVFLAYVWLIYLGVLVIQRQQLGLIARTDRFFNSIFQLGRAYLDRILEEGISLYLSNYQTLVPLSISSWFSSSLLHPMSSLGGVR